VGNKNYIRESAFGCPYSVLVRIALLLDVSLLGNKKSHTRNGLRLPLLMSKTWFSEMLLIWCGIAENYLGVIICDAYYRLFVN